MNKIKSWFFVLCLCVLASILSSCMLESTPSYSETQALPSTTPEGAEAATSNTTAPSTTYEDELISTSAFQVNGKNLSLTVPNATEVFSFLGQIAVCDNASWQISTDIYGNNVIVTKTVLLNEGDNTFYLLVIPEEEELTTLYTVTIRRKPIYTVSFQDANGEVADSILIEEGRYATSSASIPVRTGFNFAGWDYDFLQPIQEDLTIEAKWTPIVYSISYDLNGGESVDNPDTYRIVDDVELNAPTRDAYAFLGWFTSDGDKIENVRGLSASLLLTAKWECFFTIKNGIITGVSDYFKQNVSECVIPSEIDGVTITGIAGSSKPNSDDGVFCNCFRMTSITLPSSMIRIEMGAFNNCTALTAVFFTGSIAEWCKIEFASNPLFYAHNLYINNELVTDLIIPDGITNIGNNVFSGCTGLTSITIPNGVTSIGVSTFSGCTGLTSIIIPDSVTTIEKEAFAGCSGLTEAILGNGVSCIKNATFWNCSNLKSVSLGNSVTSIGDYAFEYCSALSSLIIPDSVTSIGEYAFENCTGLKEIVLGNNLKTIGECAFALCNGIFSITIPNSVTSIGNDAFYGCKALASVTIGCGLASIDVENPFGGCYSLVEIRNLSALEINPAEYVLRIYSTGDSYVHTDGNGFVFYDDGEAVVLVSYCGDLTELSLPENYEGKGYSIHDCAFYEWVGLTSITIPDNVTGIGQYAFFGCTKLTSVFFSGTTTQWETISNGADWSKTVCSCVIYCTNGEIVY